VLDSEPKGLLRFQGLQCLMQLEIATFTAEKLIMMTKFKYLAIFKQTDLVE
jgi:hypothetical protein